MNREQREDVAIAQWLSYVAAFLEANHDPRLVKHPNGGIQVNDIVGASADLCNYLADSGSLDQLRVAAQKYMTPYNRS